MLLLFAIGGSIRADLLVSTAGPMLRYDDATGVFVGVFATLPDDHPLGMTIGPDGNLYVGVYDFGHQSSFIRRFDGGSGAFLDTFSSLSGLDFPDRLMFGPDGNLYVAAAASSKIIRFDGITGSFIDDFVPSGSGGLLGASGLAFGPDGNLYVTSNFTNEVLRYDGSSGAFLDVFAGSPAPEDLAFGPDGNLYDLHVVSVGFDGTQEVVRFDGASGEFIDVFVAPFLGYQTGCSLVFGSDGGLYISTGFLGDSVRRFDGSTGELGTFVGSGSGGLSEPTRLLFAPQLCDHLGEYGPCADGAGTRCRVDGVTGVGRGLGDVSRIDVIDCGPSDGAGGFEITLDCPSGYSYCVENTDDGVGNHVKLGIVERSVVNEFMTLSQVATSFDPAPVPNGPRGTFTIIATFTNTSGTPVGDPVFRVTELANDNLVLNADAGAIGVGAALTPDVGSDGVLSPDETFTAKFVIGLQTRRKFTFFVDLLGVPEP